jgi:hypothetical protein
VRSDSITRSGGETVVQGVLGLALNRLPDPCGPGNGRWFRAALGAGGSLGLAAARAGIGPALLPPPTWAGVPAGPGRHR